MYINFSAFLKARCPTSFRCLAGEQWIAPGSYKDYDKCQITNCYCNPRVKHDSLDSPTARVEACKLTYSDGVFSVSAELILQTFGKVFDTRLIVGLEWPVSTHCRKVVMSDVSDVEKKSNFTTITQDFRQLVVHSDLLHVWLVEINLSSQDWCSGFLDFSMRNYAYDPHL